MLIWKILDEEDASKQDPFVHTLQVGGSAEEALAPFSDPRGEFAPLVAQQIDLAETLQIVLKHDCIEDYAQGYGSNVLPRLAEAVKRLKATAKNAEMCGYPLFEIDAYARELLDAVNRFCAGDI